MWPFSFVQGSNNPKMEKTFVSEEEAGIKPNLVVAHVKN